LAREKFYADVFIHRPGTRNSTTIIDPDTGLDKEVVPC
jgi:hypothetical protein